VNGRQEVRREVLSANVLSLFLRRRRPSGYGRLALEAVENGASLEDGTIKFQDKQLAGLPERKPQGCGAGSGAGSSQKAGTHLERAKRSG